MSKRLRAVVVGLAPLTALVLLDACRTKREIVDLVRGIDDDLEQYEALERALDGGNRLPPRSDVAPLRKMVWLPAGVASCRWMAEFPWSVHSRAPGPTDSTVYAFVQLSPDGWKELGGYTPGDSQAVAFDDEVARKILPASALQLDGDGGISVTISTISESRIRPEGGVILAALERVGDGVFMILDLR